MIDWSKLKPYRDDKRRSFEELCYQIAKGLYGHLGRFTPVDDSGGGDGVEFYLTLPNGDQWGWQAKFFHPHERLNVSGRKTQIKRSIKQACNVHPHLTKWFLCTPTTFTPPEEKWFSRELPKVIPEGMEIEIIHWSHSDFNDWLSRPQFVGKKLHFFGELELSLDWFQKQTGMRIASIEDKFSHLLHIETDADAAIHASLGDSDFVNFLTQQIDALEEQLRDYEEAVRALQSDRPAQIEWVESKEQLIGVAEDLKNALAHGLEELQRVCKLLEGEHVGEVQRIDWDPIKSKLEQAHQSYREEADKVVSSLDYTGRDDDKERVLREAERIVRQPEWIAANILDDLFLRTLSQIMLIKVPDLHIFGGAGVGKTHVAGHICQQRLEKNLPALLVLGSEFTGDRPPQQQLLELFDIPRSYSWNDFLQALDSTAEAYHTRISLVIDGLNESTVNGRFSDIWKKHLEKLVAEISHIAKNVVVITTSRPTFKDAIWETPSKPQNRATIYGFGWEDVEKAVEVYFDWYKIQADITERDLERFQVPLYLKLFCETVNPARQEEKQISISNYTLFQVFDEYLRQANRRVCERLGLFPKASVVVPALEKVAEYLWERPSRSIPLDELTLRMDGQLPDEIEDWPRSRTKAILDENLLVDRDRGGDDIVRFTYDPLGGYLIARYLVQQARSDPKSFFNSEKVADALFSKDHRKLHPLCDDIRRSVAALLPVEPGQHLHEIVDNPIACSVSINALFEIPPDKVRAADHALVARLFEKPENRPPLLELARSTIGNPDHPFNISFWSERLKALSMPERDISWTEYVREKAKWFEKLLERFETKCQSDEDVSEQAERRFHLLAEATMWLLTSTVRPLRDKATRALYWYGRCFPEKFLNLLLRSLDINDPYIPERMLAATYGVAMARQHDFEDPSFAETVLPVYGRKLYEAMFKPKAPYATTHILARDYARRTIDVALIHYPDLLSADDRERITPPFKDGGIRGWGESEDRNEGEYRDGNAPIHMDFENYTLGRLVRDRANYDFEHEEYKRVRANIFWRIYDLGYSLEAFGETDKWIAHSNWRYGRSADGGKTDRYGKKYSWIAFYELAGFRQDQGLLNEHYGDEARIFDADIDPSFPVDVQEYNLIQTDYLGARDISVEEWILRGDAPDLGSYLVVNELCGERGPWVLLDGYINQEDDDAKRGRFIFPRGFIVKSGEVQQIVEQLEQQDLGGRWLPEIPEDYYTYAGEIPWSDTYSPNGYSQLSFVMGYKTVEELKDEILLFRDDEPIPEKEAEEFWESISDRVMVVGETIVTISDSKMNNLLETALKKHDLEIRVCQVPVRRKIPDYQRFTVLIPVRRNNWEDYHSAITPGCSVLTPAKELAEHLELCGQPQTFDLFDRTGKRASISFRYGDKWHSVQNLIYLRQDLLERFLAEANSELIWAIWGEREYHSPEVSELEIFAKKHKSYRVYKKVVRYNQLSN